MSEHIYKSHNKTLLLYHLVFPSKYRKEIFSLAVEKSLKETCLGISKRYEIHFVEIGLEEDHVHFLVQSIPRLSVERIVTIIKSVTARQIFLIHPEVKKELWGGSLWTSGYYSNTVGQYASEEIIKRYVVNQGQYKKLYSGQLYLEL